jgi:EAL domain-containing protein (putative c-di-GMP-specific phosphodiesterase class I)
MALMSDDDVFDSDVPTRKGIGVLTLASKAGNPSTSTGQMRPTPAKARVAKAVGEAARARARARVSRALDTMWMAFQPIVDTSRGRVFGYEALMRNEEASMCQPGAVLGAAERHGCLRDLGRRTRALSARAFVQAPAGAVLFVNLHTLDLLDPELYEASAPLTRMAGRVVLEITERASLDDVPELRSRLSDLRRLGFRVAIDDLGAGYAGLSAVVALEPEFVKLDMFLVRNVHESRTRQRLIATIMAFRAGMNMNVIAEGVELPGERRQLQALDCRLMQGFLFAKPGPGFPTVEAFS